MGKKKSRVDTLSARLAIVMKSGKIFMGTKSSLKCLRAGQARLLITAANCPPLMLAEVSYRAMLARTPVHHFNGTNAELGTACGKFFKCSCLVVVDPGDSDIIEAYGYRVAEHPAASLPKA